jgi:hypothetical protein
MIAEATDEYGRLGFEPGMADEEACELRACVAGDAEYCGL